MTRSSGSRFSIRLVLKNVAEGQSGREMLMPRMTTMAIAQKTRMKIPPFRASSHTS